MAGRFPGENCMVNTLGVFCVERMLGWIDVAIDLFLVTTAEDSITRRYCYYVVTRLMRCLGQSNHRLRTCMHVVIMCNARCVRRELGFMCFEGVLSVMRWFAS